MAMDGKVGSIAALWRFPVKSMRGEQLEQAELTAQGILGDRAFAILDLETGKIASAKSVSLFPRLFACKAAFVEPPQPGRELPPVRITLSNGQVVASDSHQVDSTLSAYFQRDVRLARCATTDSAGTGTVSPSRRRAEGPDPAGHRNPVVEPKLNTAFLAAHGIPSHGSIAAFFDLFPASLLTTSTLARLAELEPESRFDARRFRMNVIVSTDEAGFPENSWIGREVTLGGAARLRVAMPDPRCVMTTLAQDELPHDPEVLRSLARRNKIPVGVGGDYPCAGVYALVVAPGTLRTGDPVGVAGE